MRQPYDLDGDVKINSVRYPLFRDPKRGLAWWKESGLDLQEGSAKEPASAVWPRGWRGGMGETKRMGRDTMGYAFSENIDCTPDGYARIAARRVTLTPTNSPGDQKTYFHQAAAAGTAVYSASNFTKSTSLGTTSQTVTHGLSVAPKAIIFWTAGKTASGTVGAGTYNSLGFTDGTTSRVVSWNSQDNQATTNAARRWAAAIISLIDASGSANQPEATISNIGATTFDVDWTNNDANAVIIHFMAIGGSDVSASVDEWATGTSNGSKSITGVGFRPELVLHLTASSTATGTAADAFMAMGCADQWGNQWYTGIAAIDGIADGDTVSGQDTTASLIPYINNGGTWGLDYGYYIDSLDADGFTGRMLLTPTNCLVATLSLRGLRAKAGSFTKKTSAGNQDALSIGFTTTAFLLASHLGTTTQGDHAAFSVGAASGTTAVEASAWLDENNANPTDSYGLDDTALAFEKIDATGAENATATCGNIDMQQTGWLNWGASDAVATQIVYIGFAALSESTASRFVYGHSGQRTWKMAVSSAWAISSDNEKDWGGKATIGQPSRFETLWELPLGGSLEFNELTTITASGADTWTAADSGVYATAFTTAQDGATAKLLRARPTNLVDLAATAPMTSTSWADDFEVGDTSSAVVEAVDTGVIQYVSKTDGLYRFATPGVATKVPIATTIDDDGGVGLVAIPGTEVAFVSYPSGLWYTDGQYVRATGPDTIRTNEAIPNVSLEPFRGRHYENAIFGRWIYSLYRVTESSTTRTYILAGYIHRLGQEPLIEWHTPFMETGSARGLGIFEVNDKVTIWTQVGGQFVMRVIGQDGSPNAGRDAIGYGAASTSYNLYLPIDDMGLPNTLKQLRCFEVKTRNINANCPVQLQVLRDGGAAANVGSTITGDGVSKRYWTLNSSDTARDVMPLLNITTGASYSDTTDDPQVWGAAIRTRPRPDRAGVYQIIIDTGAEYATDAEPPDDAKTMRDNLKALENGAPVACIDPDGNSITLAIDEVRDLELKENESGAITYTIELFAEEFVNA